MVRVPAPVAALCLALVALLAVGVPADAATRPQPAKTQGTKLQAFITWYSAVDNDPAGSRDIAYPGRAPRHRQASGVGTFDDPITFASEYHATYPPGTKIYVPRVHRYFVMEDDCACRHGRNHVDLWLEPLPGASDDDVLAAEDNLTRDTTETIIKNPPRGLPVSRAPLYQAGSTQTAPAPTAAGSAQKAIVAMYQYPGVNGMWSTAVNSNPVPNTIILDISGSGAGTAPDPTYQSWVSQAQAKGVRVLGYADTSYGGRAMADVEADVRNYAAWYNVHDIFLDQAATSWAQQGTYYQTLASYIRSQNPGAGAVWLNPGVFPDQQFIDLADTVMVFEDTYANYTSNYSSPGYVASYPATKFAHVIHTGSGTAAMQNAIGLSRQRNAGYVYVTDLTEPNPYSDFPSYWATENTAINAP